MTLPDGQADHGDTKTVHRRMDAMYRWQRHFYDLTRKYYLLGRDRVIDELDLQPGETLLEVGCGTGRNLIHIARRYPKANILGLDASEEMLKQARKSLGRAGVADHVLTGHGFAQNFDTKTVFGRGIHFDRVLFSYSLSMIPPWQGALDHTLELLPPGGKIHVVDFGDLADQSAWFRAFLVKWLDLFGVHHRPGLLEYADTLIQEGKATGTIRHHYGRYCFDIELVKPDM